MEGKGNIPESKLAGFGSSEKTAWTIAGLLLRIMECKVGICGVLLHCQTSWNLDRSV